MLLKDFFNSAADVLRDKLASTSKIKGVDIISKIKDINYIFTIVINTLPNTEVTATLGSLSIKETSNSNGDAIFYLPKEGTWKFSVPNITGGTTEKDYTAPSPSRPVQENITPAGASAHLEKLTDINIDFSSVRSNKVGGRIDKYMIFAGGLISSTKQLIVDAIDENLNVKMITPLSTASSFTTCANSDYYLIFGPTPINGYDPNLTLKTGTSISANNIAAGATKDYVMFGGGQTTATSYTLLSTVYKFNNVMTRTTATALSVARTQLTATNIEDNVLFVGGFSSTDAASNSFSSTVDVYDASGVKTTATAAIMAALSAAAHNKTHAIIAGGYNRSGELTGVVAYDKNLTKTTLTSLSWLSRNKHGISNEAGALFVGGYSTNGLAQSIAEFYNNDLTRTNPPELSAKGEYWRGASNDKYFVCTYTSNTDVYNIKYK